MRTLGPRKRASAHRPLALAAFAALVLFSGAAFAECTGTPGINIQASAGETCSASGNYVSTDVIAGQATGAGSVLTNDSDGSVSVSFSTSAANTPAVQADTGGSVTLIVAPPYATGTVTTSGAGSIGLYATGASSEIDATNVAVSTSGSAVFGGGTANGVEIDNSATSIITGGSVTTSITANGAIGIAATGGAAVTVTGTTVTSNGNGAQGLFVTGPGSSMTGSGLTVTANGSYDPITTFYSGAASNNAFGSFPTGGALTLSNSTLLTTGTQTA